MLLTCTGIEALSAVSYIITLGSISRSVGIRDLAVSDSISQDRIMPVRELIKQVSLGGHSTVGRYSDRSIIQFPITQRHAAKCNKPRCMYLVLL